MHIFNPKLTPKSHMSSSNDLAEFHCENIISELIIFGGKHKKSFKVSLKSFHRDIQ